MGAAHEPTADEEEKELRDAFRVSYFRYLEILTVCFKSPKNGHGHTIKADPKGGKGGNVPTTNKSRVSSKILQK